MNNSTKTPMDTKRVMLLMVIAYAFSMAVRMIWVYQFHDTLPFYWNGELMINTNDGYYFASGVQKTLQEMHQYNPRIPSVWSYATVALTALLVKITPFSLETIILYLPAIISSLVVIPVILIARLFKGTVWGFFAALLGSIAWSYYNRTMTGYYDTDMFSAMAPMFILYFLINSIVNYHLRSALYAALAIAIYPFLYDAGATIVYAMGIIYAAYLMFYHFRERLTYLSIILVFAALVPLHIASPYNYLLKIVLLIALYIWLQRTRLSQERLMVVSAVLLIAFLYLGNVFEMIYHRMEQYLSSGTTDDAGLHFYSVFQTIMEAGKIPFSVFANRISGSVPGLFVAVVGYGVLVWRHRPFLLSLPLVAIGMFALWGGLRFTVYAVPVAAMGAVYLIYEIMHIISDKKAVRLFGLFALSGLLIYPNIMHIVGYKVPTVLNKAEVQDLAALKKISSEKDYTVAWWDYGYPLWFYSDTNTLIDGGKHQNDNFIVSTILQTTSPKLAANLSRLAVETYVDTNYSIVADTIFKNGQEDQKDPNQLLSDLSDGTYPVPPKTRDIYLYLPYRMLAIFPTVMQFGNLDLSTGETLYKSMFYPARAVKNDNGVLLFSNSIIFDTHKGILLLNKQTLPVKAFFIASVQKDGTVQVQTQPYHADAHTMVVYMKSYGQFVVMDERTFHSMYVQMFIFGKYDKTLFDPVVISPYSRIYRLKR